MAYKTYLKKPWQFLSLTWTYLSLEAYRPHWCFGAESAGISFFIKDKEFFCLFPFSLTVWQSHSLYSIWLLLMCLNMLLLWIASKISVYISPLYSAFIIFFQIQICSVLLFKGIIRIWLSLAKRHFLTQAFPYGLLNFPNINESISVNIINIHCQ